MAESSADVPSVSITDRRIGTRATEDEADGYWMPALETVPGATESSGSEGDGPVRARTEAVDR